MLIENAKRRELAAQQRELDQNAFKLNLNKAEEQEIKKAAESKNKQDKRVEFINELTA